MSLWYINGSLFPAFTLVFLRERGFTVNNKTRSTFGLFLCTVKTPWISNNANFHLSWSGGEDPGACFLSQNCKCYGGGLGHVSPRLVISKCFQRGPCSLIFIDLSPHTTTVSTAGESPWSAQDTAGPAVLLFAPWAVCAQVAWKCSPPLLAISNECAYGK